jgi:hypothetical protein
LALFDTGGRLQPPRAPDTASVPRFGQLALFVQPAGAGPRRPAVAGVPTNWVCLAHLPPVPQAPSHPAPPAKLGLFVRPALGAPGGVAPPVHPQSATLSSPAATGGRNPKSAIEELASSRTSHFTPQTSNIDPRAASDRDVPLPRGRVARIVTKFCVRPRPESRATPCA